MDTMVLQSPLEVQVDSQTPHSWDEVISQFRDANIYQTWAYGAVRWGARNLSHLVIRRDGRVMAAAQLRIARLPLLPAGVAYLRWGPLCHRIGHGLDLVILSEMIAALRGEYCARRGLSLQIIPNAFSGDERGDAFGKVFSQSSFRRELNPVGYRTVVVDLTVQSEVIRKRLNQKWRNQLNGSEKNGLTLEASDGGAAYSDFVHLYREMWKRKQFETSVDVDEFGRIQEQLDVRTKMQTFLARKDGKAIAALVCSLMGDTAIYVLGATNEQARMLKAAYFLHWQAILWLKNRGACLYDLGGIDSQSNQGGYHFKNGFGGADVTQVPSHVISSGALGDAVFRAISWIRHRDKTSKSSVPNRS